MNCLIYLRVSTKEQAEEGYSIAAQREACVRFIRDKGWNLVDEYTDRGESARSADRPQLQEMLHRIKHEKSIDAILVHKVDRLARNIEDHGAIRGILRKNNVQLVSVTENIEDSASGRLVEGILATIAEFYSANLALEIKKGMTQKVKEGGWPHAAPVGYKNIRDEKGVAHVVVEPEQASLVKEAFRLYATGNYSTTEIQQIMAKKGLKTKRFGRPLSPSKIQEMLKNPFYTGLVIWKDIQYKGCHEPLIPKVLFLRVQEVMRIHDTAGERKRKHPHYLRGTAFCGECGSRMSSTTSKEKTYFYCIGQQRKRTICHQRFVPVDELETGMEKLYGRIELKPEIAATLKAAFQNEILEKESFNVTQEKVWTKKMTKLVEEREKLLHAYYANAITLDLLKKEQGRISDEMAQCEARLSEASIRLDQAEKVLNLAIKMASSCSLGYQKASPKTKRLFNQAFFKKVYIKDRKVDRVDYTDFFGLLFLYSGLNKDSLVEDTGIEPVTSCLQGTRSPS